MWQLPPDSEAPPTNSLLGHLWPVVAATPRDDAGAEQRAIDTARDRAGAAAARRTGRSLAGRRCATDSADAAPRVRLGGAGRRTRRHSRSSLLAAHRGAGSHELERAPRGRHAGNFRSRARAARRRVRGARQRGRARSAGAFARARRQPRPVGARAASGGAFGAQDDAARRASCSSTCGSIERSSQKAGAGSSTSRRASTWAATSGHFSSPRSPAMRRNSSATRTPSPADDPRPVRALFVFSVAWGAALVAGGRYSEPVKLRRRRPSASGSAVMTSRPATRDSGAPARGSTRASSA